MSKKGSRKSKQVTESTTAPVVDRAPPWSVIYYRAANGTVPAFDFLDSCPGKIEAEFVAVLDAVERRRRPSSLAAGSGRRCTAR